MATKAELEALLDEQRKDIDFLISQRNEARRAQQLWSAAYHELAEAYRKETGKVWPVCKITEKKVSRY